MSIYSKSVYTHAKMLSPVPVCKYMYFRIPTTISWFTDLQVHSVFAIFSVTDEGVQWVRYIISVVVFFIKTKHSHSPADCPFSGNSDVISDTCAQASIHEPIYNVIKVCTDLSQLNSDHAPSIKSQNRPNLPKICFYNPQSSQSNRSVTILM